MFSDWWDLCDGADTFERAIYSPTLRLVNPTAFAGILMGLLGATGFASAAVDPIVAAQSALKARRASEGALRDRVVRYSVATYWPWPSDPGSLAPPADARTPSYLAIVAQSEVWLGSGPWIPGQGARYRIVEEVLWTRDGTLAPSSVARHLASDGSSFVVFDVVPSQGVGNLLIDSGPAFQRPGAQMDAFGWAVLGESGGWTYSD